MEAAALATRSASQQRPASVTAAATAAAAHGHRRATAARRRRAPCGRLRALPPELSEILSPKLVPGSPSDTGDVSSLIPVRRVALVYLISSMLVHDFTRNCKKSFVFTLILLIGLRSALMLLLYFMTNWVVPELILKRLQNKANGEADASVAASMSLSGDAADGDASRRRLKGKKKKNKKATINV
ncbi:hypothetical protein HU200_020305 [Digitaria exilis]|uniref:Uncharacterized protein n=1 Tax=Digitaria exilis TaxID=1010633 RepID=A0A835F1V3_9POAL|nr:hypothetical protein HU200_020305 [Digitaria exilis]